MKQTESILLLDGHAVSGTGMHGGVTGSVRRMGIRGGRPGGQTTTSSSGGREGLQGRRKAGGFGNGRSATADQARNALQGTRRLRHPDRMGAT